MAGNPLRELDALNPELVEGPNSVTLFTRSPLGPLPLTSLRVASKDYEGLVRRYQGPLIVAELNSSQ